MFKIWLLLGRMGFFCHNGLRGHEPHWWPKARVRYDDCIPPRFSVPMSIGSAVKYADIFKGVVVPLEKTP
jgi:hypothetical protein